MWTSGSGIFAIAVIVQLVALLSVALARVSERSSAQSLCQQVFLTTLLAMGALAALTITADWSCRFVVATTLPLMAVGATIDFHRSPPDSAF